MMSRTTPVELSNSAMIRPINTLFSPPRGGFQTPSSEMASLARTSSLVAPVALFSEFGIPGVVKCDGESTVRMERTRNPLLFSLGKPTETATTASATASSSLLGS